ncbi:MAG TPA: ABC transporter permease subunit [Lachnospiraceae bacterium]|nr:ABC transporter permease subunit [Lachnospiraceae bacterium]
MSKLLSAEFMRLLKAKIFWICFGFMAAFGIFIGLKVEKGVDFDQAFFIFPLVMGFVLAAFCSLFIGTEYSDGTLRNKLIVGHKRGVVYLTNLLVCFTAALSMTLVSLFTVCVLGVPRLGWFTEDTKVILLLLLISFLLLLSYTAVYTLVCMLISSKAIAAVGCLLGVMVLMVVAATVKSRLEEPKYYDFYTYTDSAGTTEEDTQPNPNYLSGTKREVYQAVLEILPTGQSLQISLWTVVNPLRMAGYSLIIIFVTTLAGILVFQRKDLK